MGGSRSVFLIAIKFTTLRHFYAEADHVCDRLVQNLISFRYEDALNIY
ncbi:hypothetical protein COO91_03346 [Nostoc flagelliforme CCNUN1]|uniref:Uncharacterized protein n=1 Tax=Nostoc flagelliforme CCNUN1 TaxID=2038116 RepID=A0A2K8SPQ0_9NOSO|nr:hypothetical protein COO91_03346 [Nostoc flagelliforme CCNUN1]